MAITALSGPIVQFGTTLTSTGGDLEHNSQRGPMVTDLGNAVMDPRIPYAYTPGSSPTTKTVGLWDSLGMVDAVPSSASVSNIAAAQQPVAGTALTLSASGGVTSGVSITAPETGQTVTGLFAIDTAMSPLGFGGDATVGLWDPSKSIARAITIRPSSNLDAGFFTVAGRDLYGFKMTELLAAGSTTINGLKAFKYISSVTASTTITSTGITVGTQDVFGFPIRLDNFLYLFACLTSSAGAATFISTSATVTFASTRATQVSTAPDVRGTLATSAAMSGANRLGIAITMNPVQVATITSTTAAGIFGATQFSSV